MKHDIHAIMAALPHRYPFLLVDRICELTPGERIVALKNVTVNEPFFQGHFPNNPVMPGVLIIEALAQAGGLLVRATEEAQGRSHEGYLYLAGVDKARFRRAVVPGDQLMLECEVKALRSNSCKVTGRALVDGKVAAQAELLSMLAPAPEANA